jgi:hypothetical protein
MTFFKELISKDPENVVTKILKQINKLPILKFFICGVC